MTKPKQSRAKQSAKPKAYNRRGESKTSPRRLEHMDNVRLSLELRKTGYTYERIAQQCGWANASSAYRAVQDGLKLTLQEPADDLRNLELARLDGVLVGVYQQAVKGSLSAVDRVIKIMERRSRLLGLDKPIQVDVDWRSELERAGVPWDVIFEQLVQKIVDEQTAASRKHDG